MTEKSKPMPNQSMKPTAPLRKKFHVFVKCRSSNSLDNGRSHGHNGNRIRFDHSTVQSRFDRTGQDPPATQSAARNFAAVHTMQ